MILRLSENSCLNITVSQYKDSLSLISIDLEKIVHRLNSIAGKEHEKIQLNNEEIKEIELLLEETKERVKKENVKYSKNLNTITSMQSSINIPKDLE